MFQALQKKILDTFGTTFLDDFLGMSLGDFDIFRVLCVTGRASRELLQRKLGLERQGRTGNGERRRRHHFSRRFDVLVDEDISSRIPDVTHGVDIVPWHVGRLAISSAMSSGKSFCAQADLALAVLAAVEIRGTNTINFNVSATCARSVCWLAADHAYTARFALRSSHA